ncbi:PepSY-associated TM helix domain-containing protein [Larkinella sp. VNQ87]|uniref:PepSY-associated TM helix domain-containing protein n=1 Tax=Larkinella sp. VNQ87 TaxID=3400921 RepID=UPI003BFFC7AD
MSLKKIVGKVHLWLGMVTSLVVVVSMLAAAVFVWDDELTDWYYRDYVFVASQNRVVLPLDSLYANAQKAARGRELEGVQVWNSPERAYVFTTYKRNKTGPGWTHWDDYVYWDKFYVNPYTGKVLGVVDMLRNPVDLTRRLHQNLLLRYEIGRYIVGFSTLFVILLALTGIVLWFPKNKAALKQRFSIKWKAKWRRVNYDIHNVGGLYTHLLILFLAITGLVWTFRWWTDGIYRILGNDPKTVFQQNEHPQPALTNPRTAFPMDAALRQCQRQRPTWTEASLTFEKPEDAGKAGEIAVFLRFNGTAWDASDNYYYNRQTGAPIHQVRHEQKTLGATWRNSNYAMHVGSIYGWPTKVLASFAALFLASLPITGFLIWWGRRKKRPRNLVTAQPMGRASRPVQAFPQHQAAYAPRRKDQPAIKSK